MVDMFEIVARHLHRNVRYMMLRRDDGHRRTTEDDPDIQRNAARYRGVTCPRS